MGDGGGSDYHHNTGIEGFSECSLSRGVAAILAEARAANAGDEPLNDMPIGMFTIMERAHNVRRTIQ